MKRLLLLALPALLAGCPKPRDAGEAKTPAATASATPAAPAAAAAPKIEFAEVAMIRAAATLPKFHWRLANATDAKGQRIDALFVDADKPVQLDFKGTQLAVSNTCNRMNGSYQLKGKQLTIGKLASTMMACPDPKRTALDQEVGKRLPGTLALRMSKGDAPPQLELKTASGDVLVFASEETAASRHRSTAERVFLEVAAKTAPCQHPLIENMQCLQVRELKYDDKGLKVGKPGPFGNFYATIEGYTHEPGVRNVLRVDRFEIKDPPADAPSQAYVLDMVVESDASAKP
jgi:heat shock protein HslJ